ncbi:AAA family ATPase [Faecalibacterium wellingii]|uniref:AAA family ATPase n=1 Tax=Faecalibacterium wellingii TaxID=2929491 RepID=A0ABU3U154_9FIRM|nr:MULTISPECIES: AAA family ATPase [Faecalibacterium]MDU8689294.1 AAA family ATPase [Faecalibacterium prausnitzii]UQK57118.1 AAA family ATPase [Faecalibacterium sp. HTF-F]
MAQESCDLWLERFKREAGIKSAVILSGNTSDIMRNPQNNGVYQPVLQVVIDTLRSCKYTSIIKWDRVDGVDPSLSDPVILLNTPPAASSDTYDLGDDLSDTSGSSTPAYRDPDEFFPYLLDLIRHGTGKTAFILDYSDYLFGNANSLSEKERNYLATLGKALQLGRSYDMLSTAEEAGNIVVLVTKNSASIPPSFYLNNPLVSTINIPLPGHTEREMFTKTNLSLLRIDQDLTHDITLMADFIDALDGFTLCETAQLFRLSRLLASNSDSRMTFEKLINLYKYGEKTSPWEELSKEKLTQLEERLGQRVKGQNEAIRKVKDVIIRAYTGFSGLQHSTKQRKPKGTLFFVGPTGVGKTELAKSLAEFVFGDETACIRFDMSEYNHDHSDQRLVGAPPGYVGYEAGGQLTNAVKERPFCVLLFDEIEKADGKILDKFLQILEDGRLTDGKGETVSFSESIIIFTSNIGAAHVSADLTPSAARSYFIQEVRQHFIENLHRPELLNRIGDNIVAFNFIEDPAVFAQIAKSKFKGIENFIRERYKAELVFRDETTAFQAIAGKAGKENGGRGLLNVMESSIINPLSEFVFENSESLAGRQIVICQFDPAKAFFTFELE